MSSADFIASCLPAAAFVVLGLMQNRGIRFKVWHFASGWGVICAVFVFLMFWKFDFVIQPGIFQSRAGSDGYVAASLAEWGLGEVRETGNIPAWNPYICGGMPTEGGLLFVWNDANPIGKASAIMNGYHPEWDRSSAPIEFNFANFVGNTARIYFAPVGFLVLAVVSLYYFVVG